MLDASKKGWSSELKGVSLKASIKTPVVVLLVAVFALCFAAMLSLSLVDRIAWHSDEIWLVVLPAVLAILVAVLFMKKIEMGILMNVALVIIASALSLSSFFFCISNSVVCYLNKRLGAYDFFDNSLHDRIGKETRVLAL